MIGRSLIADQLPGIKIEWDKHCIPALTHAQSIQSSLQPGLLISLRAEKWKKATKKSGRMCLMNSNIVYPYYMPNIIIVANINHSEARRELDP